MGDVLHKRDTPVARHVSEFHGVDPNCLKFTVVEVIRPPECGRDWNRRIPQKETELIHRLQYLEPHGLNDNIYFGCFI